MALPVDTRLRGNDGPGWDLQDWGDATHRYHPLIPVSGTGTGSLIPLPSRERGIGGWNDGEGYGYDGQGGSEATVGLARVLSKFQSS